MYPLYLLVVVSLLTSCGHREDLAPVYELEWSQQSKQSVQSSRRDSNASLTALASNSTKSSTYIVGPGETLHALAFRYDQDLMQFAKYNHLQSPYTLHEGQVLKLLPPAPMHEGQVLELLPSASTSNSGSLQEPIFKSKPVSAVKTETIFKAPAVYSKWHWPLVGRVVNRFIPQQGKKGIDIAGKKGVMIVAACDGVVAYAGAGLSGYGNLILLKHEGQFLTAYGNNSRNKVVEGQHVKAGQIIAEIGMIDKQYAGVHFEIRKAGKPVDPLEYLPKN
jgi:lipoprotein NlpD